MSQLSDKILLQEEGAAQPQFVSRFFKISLLIFVTLGLLAIIMLLLTNRLRSEQKNDSELMEAVIGTKTNLSESHLWLEKYLMGYSDIDIDGIFTQIDTVREETAIIIEGGINEGADEIRPVRDPELIRRQARLLSTIDKFTELARRRVANPAESGIGTPLDQEFDNIFYKIIQEVEGIESLLEENEVLQAVQFNRFFWGILLTWVGALFAGFIIFQMVEKRRLLLIAARNKAIAELRESEKRTVMAQKVGKIGIWDWDPNTGDLVWSDEVYTIFGFTPCEIEPTYELFLEMLNPDDRGEVSASVEAALYERKPYKLDCRIIRKDGSEGFAEATGEVLFDKEDKPIRMLGTFMDITERKELESKLTKLATTDPLTGAFNRAKFDDLISMEVARAKRFAHPLTIVLFDIDNFKLVNDRYGHAVGDTVLKTIADIIFKNSRATNYFVRWGGEEFVVIAVETDTDGALKLAERMRSEIEAHAFETVGKVTASFGVALLAEDDTVDSLIMRADEALYRAKENGRNRVEV